MDSLVGRYELVLYCPSSFSLKDKRQHVSSLLDRARDSLNVSAAEVDYQDHHRLTRLAFSTVSSERSRIDQVFESLESLIDEEPSLQVREQDRDIF